MLDPSPLPKAERDSLVRQLAAARRPGPRAEGDAISSTSEFAAVHHRRSDWRRRRYGCARGHTDHRGGPDVLAVLLLVAAGYLAPKAPAIRRAVRRRRTTRPPLRPAPALRVAA
jgi:hypothetical protein